MPVTITVTIDTEGGAAATTGIPDVSAASGTAAQSPTLTPAAASSGGSAGAATAGHATPPLEPEQLGLHLSASAGSDIAATPPQDLEGQPAADSGSLGEPVPLDRLKSEG